MTARDAILAVPAGHNGRVLTALATMPRYSSPAI